MRLKLGTKTASIPSLPHDSATSWEEDDCIVTAAWTPPFIRDAGDEFTHSEDEVLVSLNCAGSYASATNPGASLASPMGREAKAAADEAAAEEAAELEAASTPDE